MQSTKWKECVQMRDNVHKWNRALYGEQLSNTQSSHMSYASPHIIIIRLENMSSILCATHCCLRIILFLYKSARPKADSGDVWALSRLTDILPPPHIIIIIINICRLRQVTYLYTCVYTTYVVYTHVYTQISHAQ